jgi:hypothetical protein
VVTLRDGRLLERETLPGVELELGGGDAAYVIRFDGIAPDPHAHDQSVTLYDLSVQDPTSGRWDKLCEADPYSRTTAIPVPGFWDEDGRFVPGAAGEISFACTAGAQAECVRFGYPPGRRVRTARAWRRITPPACAWCGLTTAATAPRTRSRASRSRCSIGRASTSVRAPRLPSSCPWHGLALQSGGLVGALRTER